MNRHHAPRTTMRLHQPVQWALAGLVLLLLGGFALWGLRPDSSAPGPSAPTVPGAATPSNTLATGQHATTTPPASTGSRSEDLARAYCASCHLFPTPELLDQATWKESVLPDMKSWLGLMPPPGERLPDGSFIDDPSVYPSSPVISQEDWDEIENYYMAHAPAALPWPTPALPVNPTLRQFQAQALPYHRDVPMTTLVKIHPGAQVLYVGDAMTRTLEAMHMSGQRLFTVEFDSGPISIHIRRDSLDLTLVGRLFPSDQAKGKVLRLKPGLESMDMTQTLGDLRRPVDADFSDLNGDGREDVVVCQFGHRHGRLSWFENQSSDGFKEHVLLDRPGAAAAGVADFNGDNRPDVMAVMSQAWEGVSLFLNLGEGKFEESRIVEQPPTFGYSGLELTDFNGDGRMDFLTVNGDKGESMSPHRPYHGIRLYLNGGSGQFTEVFFHPQAGVYKVLARDFDQDGDMDLASISYYPDYVGADGAGFVYLENLGDFKFQPHTFADAVNGRWMTMDAGDLDGDGDEDLVLGSLVLGPETIPIPEAIRAQWRQGGPAVLWLRNTLR